MKTIHLLGASFIALVVSAPACAQADPRAPVTAPGTQGRGVSTDAGSSDDIIVTASKREQTLQDVPISVSVTSAQTIERAQIRDLIDLQTVVPSLKVAQFNAVGQTNFIIRGFGNGNGNFGIEGSVGVFIDGVYRSRSAASLNDLPEIERIEVLRGPQSTLFGKNVSAGAISIITKRPQFDFGGRVDLTVGNYGQMIAKATATGPLSKTVAVRLSGTINERDGFYQNVVTRQDVNDRDRGSLRADVLWQPSSNLSVRVIGDYNEITERCCGTVQLLNGPATQFLASPAPFGLGATVSNPATKFDRNIAFNQDPTNHIVGKGVSGQVDYDTSFAKFTSISAYRDQLDSGAQDVDFTGADLSNRVDRTRIKTFTQEFRIASTGKGPFTWLVGAFYDHENLDTRSTINFGSQIRAFADALSGASAAVAGHSNLFALEYLQSLVNPNIHPGSTYFAAGQAVTAPYTLKQDSYSIFGQADYKVTDRLTLTGGVSYLNDRKASTSNVVLTDAFSRLNLQNVPELATLAAIGVPGIKANSFGALGALQFFYGNAPTHGPVNYPNANESGVLKGDKVTYLGRAAYDFGFLNAYVSYSTGWKAGAFNLSTDARAPDANGIGRTADPENVTLYEAGLKAAFHGGFFNLAVFKQDIRGFQSNAYTGTGYSLVNAGKESVRGFEADAAYKPIPWLAVTGSVTYLDPKYDSFLRAPCVNYDTVRCPLNPLTGQRPLFRDLSGVRPAGISKWSFSTSATLSHSLTTDISAFLRGEYDYASKVQLTETTPPELNTYGLNNVNASLGFTSASAKVDVLLWVRNLTQNNTLIGAFPTVAQDGSYSGYVNDPRTYGVTLTKRF
ncbi:TonB-dependent receptor [Sphingomonas glacialis]|uniref:TonB-dependent receptor n=1 Tax=Sphingomonas glacialis TaxID=658225 RepID=A0ABQ3LUP5_9SPHN|nr:TonB-dependent receptor [Sphingomonas glacialis]GHH26198.1 TonB-dependent receptor [Sphingomonas glacialis]